MRPINVWLPEHQVELLDKLVLAKYVANRNEAIREAVRDYLKFYYLEKQTLNDVDVKSPKK